MENKFIENKEAIISLLQSFDFIDEAYLFGSYAYGTPHQESDIDLCIVVKDGFNNEISFESVNFQLFAMLCNKGVAHDLIMLDHQTKQREKDNKDYVYYPIFHQGIRLF